DVEPRDGATGTGQPLRARRRRDGALGSQRQGARRSRAPPARGARARERATVVVARRRELGSGGRGGSREGRARPPHLQDQDGRAPGGSRRRESPAAPGGG